MVRITLTISFSDLGRRVRYKVQRLAGPPSCNLGGCGESKVRGRSEDHNSTKIRLALPFRKAAQEVSWYFLPYPLIWSSLWERGGDYSPT